MPAALAGPLNRVKTLLSTISVGQKIVIGLLLAGLVLGGVFFTKWITAPTMAPLYSNLASTDASAIVDQLNTDGVPYTLADGGATIMVAQDQVNSERLAMSGKGLPANNATGYALLDQQGITTSEFQQQVSYQRALEGELASTLKALDGVNSAVVHIALPKEQVFATDQGKPTASVLLDLAPGKRLAGEQVQAVTHLVSSSIEKMDPADVTVADSTGAVLSAAGQVSSAVGDAQSQQEQEFEARLAANAQQILDTVAGPGNAKVSVRADLDFSKRDTTSESYNYTPNTPALSETTTKENYAGTGSAVGGVLGAEGTTANGNGNSTYGKESTTSNNAVGKTTETIQGAPGAINRLTVSVVMNDAQAGTLNQNTIQNLVGNAVGLDTTRGDAITVASMAFDQTAAQQAKADLAAAAAAEKSRQMWSMIRTGGIVAGILVLVLIVWLRNRRRRDEDYEELELDEDPELDRIQVQSIREPELDDAEARMELAQREKVRGEIAEMVSDRPDEVATMLRGWFADAK
jgi:flagellar M-ring protein FliF